MRQEELGRKARARTHVPEEEIAELRDVEFPLAMRGYDRASVDSYVSRVNRLLAELQITAAPEAAIKHALDEVTEETRGILERAHEAAESITHRSRAQADDRLQLAEREGEEVRAAADAYAREIREVAQRQLNAFQADADRLWEDRLSVIADMRALAQQLEAAAGEADERYGQRPQLQPSEAPAAEEPAAEALQAEEPAAEALQAEEPAAEAPGAGEPTQALQGEEPTQAFQAEEADAEARQAGEADAEAPAAEEPDAEQRRPEERPGPRRPITVDEDEEPPLPLDDEL